ncbi:hypothetical protein WHR41_00227 [Cladosporium halotolerans]|uniref:Transposase n=1 Tax=Cladosporium halotolerans TaxID=1052096 RepID=A0AB34L2G8_9PEZI
MHLTELLRRRGIYLSSPGTVRQHGQIALAALELHESWILAAAPVEKRSSISTSMDVAPLALIREPDLCRFDWFIQANERR